MQKLTENHTNCYIILVSEFLFVFEFVFVLVFVFALIIVFIILFILMFVLILCVFECVRVSVTCDFVHMWVWKYVFVNHAYPHLNMVPLVSYFSASRN